MGGGNNIMPYGVEWVVDSYYLPQRFRGCICSCSTVFI